MELISFPRIGLDGELYSRDDVEKAFVKGLVKEISDRLDQIDVKTCREKKVVTIIKRHLGYLLLAKPEELVRIKKYSDCICLFGKEGVERTGQFKTAVHDAFHYEYYRHGRLVKHAERLNVKTCCYCNLNYTLLIEEKKARTFEKKALFQFDHFYDQVKYPHLSMSMYNLIPSCVTCNQGKPDTCDLPIFFNPYYASIFELYRFKVKDPMQLYLSVSHPEKIEVECEAKSKEDISYCDSWFHLAAKYGVHKDIVKEVFDKAKQFPYYSFSSNFSFLRDGATYPLRLLLGVYPDIKDMNKRPMSKFIMDLWDQAISYRKTHIIP